MMAADVGFHSNMTKQAFLYLDEELGLQPGCVGVDPNGIILGRNASNGLSLPMDSVSRRHAHLQRIDEQWVIKDLQSSNGTFVNGERITSHVLNDGDFITLGKATLTFKLAEENAPSPCGDQEHSSGLRLVADEEDSSIILSTRLSDQTPYRPTSAGISAQEHLDILNQRLLALYRLSDILRGASRRDQIIKSLVDLVFENLPADRGVVLKFVEDTEDLTPELFRFREDSENREFVLSRTITRRALNDRVAVLSRDIQMDSRFSNSESVLASDSRSAMCVPLAGKRSLMGLLFLDTRESVHAFTEDDLAFVSALATDAAMTLENLALMDENIRQERLAAVGQTISGLAHNIKNILQLARGGLDLMDGAIEKKNFDDIATLWPITRRSIDRMQVLTHEMLDYSRQSRPELAPAEVNVILTRLVEMLKSNRRAQSVAVDLELDDNCGEVLMDSDGLNKALMNLLSNAFDALNGRPDARVVMKSERHKGNVVVRIKDNGPGIPSDVLPRIFQPFFSTKGSKGNGLGLSMTRKYVEDMGGRLDVTSEPGHGCEFIIVLNGE